MVAGRSGRLRVIAKPLGVAAVMVVSAFLLVRACATHVGGSGMIGKHVREKRAAFRPPPGVDTLAGLVAAGEVTSVRRVVRGADLHYVGLGDYVPGTLASGPRCYLVNGHGLILDYSPTSGDGELAGACDQPGEDVPPDAAIAQIAAQLPR